MIIDNVFDVSNDGKLIKYLGNNKSIIFPKEIIMIGKDVFNNADYLEEVTIPSTVIEIEEGAFANCLNLKKVIFKTGTKIIGKRAFYNCVNLRFVSLPSNLDIIDEEAFYNCSSLKKEGIEIITASTIGVRAFSHCSSLKTVSLSRVETIKEEAFSDCASLEYIIIPPWVEHLEKHIFYRCPKLNNIYFDYKKDFYERNINDGHFSDDIVEIEKRRYIYFKMYDRDPHEIIPPTINISGHNDLMKEAINHLDFIAYQRNEENGFEVLVTNGFKNITIKDNIVEAKYVGTSDNPYLLKLTLDNNKIKSRCNCPAFNKWGSKDGDCKHTYALKYLLHDYFIGHKLIYSSVANIKQKLREQRDKIRQINNKAFYQELPQNGRLLVNNQESAFKLINKIKDIPIGKCFYFDNFINFQKWLIKTFDREGYSVSQFHSSKSFKDLIIRLLKSKKTTCYVMRRFPDTTHLEDISYDYKNEIPKYDSFDHVPFWEGEYYRFTKLSSLRDIDLDNRRLLSAYNMTNLVIYNDEGEIWLFASSLY